MAIRAYPRLPFPPTPAPTSPVGFQRPAASPPLMQSMGATGIGGGTPPAPAALDPRGLVPVNRTQPVATDGAEVQRLMERRLGTMPPSSFSGAGAGFVPLDRPATAASIFNPAAVASDTYGVTSVQQPASLSAEAVDAATRANAYTTNDVRRGMFNRLDPENMSPEGRAALEAMRARMTARRQGPPHPIGQGQGHMTSRQQAHRQTSADQIRAMLADQFPNFPTTGLRGGLLSHG